MTRSAIDGQTASSARIYNYLLGGPEHFSADREAADILMSRFPTVQALAKANRGFVLRAARAMAEAGITQFLDIGCGLPMSPNTHDAVREVNPDARVVYVDSDPIVVVYGRAWLDRPGVVTIAGDLREPEAILASQEAALDLSRPIGVLTVAVLHFIVENDAGQHVARLRDLLAPGSHIALTHACADTVPREEIEAGQAMYGRSANPVRVRTREEIRALFDGLELLEPGLVPVADWRPTPDDPFPESAPEALGAIARVPH